MMIYTGASGGDAAANGFMISASSSTVLGFSLTGAVIPAGSGTLLENVDCTQGQLDSFVFSGQGGTALTVDWGEGGEPPCDDIDNDDICDDVDDCVGEYDECGVCNGPGGTYQCDDGSYVCDASDCPDDGECDAQVCLTLDGSDMNYTSTEDIAGFQFDHDDCATGASGRRSCKWIYD